jgi:hypothetical protein
VARAERHPVRQRPELPAEQQFEVLRECVAQLWDEVWWHHLPWWRRLGYWLQGFRSPIARFYETE